MREEIELWASIYSWEELSNDQQLLVGNEIGKKVYVELYDQFQSLKELESPSDDRKALILGIPKKNSRKTPLFYIAGMAACLLIGLFLGKFQFEGDFVMKPVFTADTLIQEKIDTVLLTKTDTVIVEKWQTKIQYQKVKEIEIVENQTTNPIQSNYKVPAPEFILNYPKNEKEAAPLKIDLQLKTDKLIGENFVK